MRKGYSSTLLGICLSLLTALQCFAHGGPTLELMHDAPETDLAPYTTNLCTADTDASLETIRKAAGFEHIGRNAINLGFTRKACWFHIPVKNISGVPAEWILSVDFPALDEVDVYETRDRHVRHTRMGDSLPYNQRPVQSRTFVLPVDWPANTEGDLFIRVRTTSSMLLPLHISSAEHFLEKSLATETLNGLFYGTGFGLFIFNLFLYISIRERGYFYYILHLLTAWGCMACVQGMGFRVWGVAGGWNDLSNYLFMVSTTSFGLLYSREFLGLAQRPMLFRASSRLALTGLIITLLIPFIPLPVRGYICAGYCTLGMVYIGGIALRRKLDRAHEAGYFILAWIAPSTLMFNEMLHFAGFPYLAGGTLGTLQAAMIIQHCFTSLLLSKRISRLKQENLNSLQDSMEARAENIAKTEFLAKMSHEIRTPMNGVLGMIQLLRETSLSPQQKSYVSTIYNSGQALLTIINDILDYSKIQAGKLKLEITPFNLYQLVNECTAIFNPQSREKKVPLLLDIASDTPEALRGDPLRLRQVLLNLLSNAFKFTEHGRIILRIRPEKVTTEEVELRFEVEDTGIGIAPEDQPRLFQFFNQADSSMTRRYGGSGLGLAISNQLVELMGGKIGVRSHLGIGSTFWFTVTMKPDDQEQPAPSQPTPTSESSLPPPARLLVVEDNKVNQMVLLGLLKKLGQQAAVVENGKQAVSYYQSHPDIDLIFMDCEMPVMDGYEATRRIRAIEQTRHLERCRIVALTAHAMPHHRENCLAAGMDDHITKPIDLATLRERLGIHLQPPTAGHHQKQD